MIMNQAHARKWEPGARTQMGTRRTHALTRCRGCYFIHGEGESLCAHAHRNEAENDLTIREA
jgi:hypothetical protein